MKISPGADRNRQVALLDSLCDQFETQWKSGQAPCLADYLEQVPAELRDDIFSELLLLDVSYRFDRGESPTADEYIGRFRTYAGIIGDVFSSQRNADTFDGPGQDETARSVHERELKFPDIAGLKFLRLLGRGGMGIVFLAEQTGLRRLVAVKVLRAGEDAGHWELTRFQIEIEAASRLRHPNIVQVYQAGQQDGKPYCVMEYVEGGTLKELIQGNLQEPCASARFILKIARAMDHAHNAGIVHRDLKPANILIERIAGPSNAAAETQIGNSTKSNQVLPRESLSSGQNENPSPGTGGVTGTSDRSGCALGEQRREPPGGTGSTGILDKSNPRIADFGLARRVEEVESAHTLSGAILGTPSYMAPEQAAGNSKQVGPKTDIHAMGVILFEMLTGRPPHIGTDTLETLQLVRSREAVSPRSLRPAIPRDLSIICLKCLSVDPLRRYGSANELANDLDRFLRNEPITARSMGRLERFQSWRNREKKLAWMGTLVVCLILIGLSASLLFWNNNRKLGISRFEHDLQEISEQLGFIDQDEIALVPGMDEVRRRFLERLAARCQTLLDDGWNLPSLQRQVAMVHFQSGTIHCLLGHYALAEAALGKAIEIQTPIATSSDCAEGDMPALSASRLELAKLMVVLGRFEEAELLLIRSIGDLEKETISDEIRLDLAEMLHRLGGLQIMTGRHGDGETSLRDSIRLLTETRLMNAVPSRCRLEYARVATSLGLYLTATSRLTESAKLLDDVVLLLEEEAGADESPVSLLVLAQSLTARSRILQMLGREQDMTKDLLHACNLLNALADEYPLRAEYRIEAGFALQNAARANGEIAQEIAATGSGQTSDPDVPPLERRYRQALALQEQLQSEFPEVVSNRRRLALTMNELATWLFDKSTYLDDPSKSANARAESESLHSRSREILEQLVAEFPVVPDFRTDLARCHQRFGIVLDAIGRIDEAEQMYLASIEIQRELAREYPGVIAHRLSLSALKNNLGVLYDHRGDADIAEPMIRQAISHAREVFDINPLHPTPRIMLAGHTDNLVDLLVRTGRHQLAAPMLADVHRYWPKDHWRDNTPELARYREIIEAANQDQTLEPDERAILVEGYEEDSIDFIREFTAKVAVPADELLDWLRNSGLFNHLLHRKEFDLLLSELSGRIGAENK